MRRTVIALAALAASLAAPATAQAEFAYNFLGVLTYDADSAGSGSEEQVDMVTATETSTQITFTDTSSPSGSPGFGCSGAAGAPAVCSKFGIVRVLVRTGGLDDSVTANIALNAELNGGAGNDTLRGGTGADTLNGGDGNDLIDAADGVADTVDCGAGDDRATTDSIDTVVNCETDPVVEVPVTTAVVPKKESAPAPAPAPDLEGGEPIVLQAKPTIPSPVTVLVQGEVKVSRAGVAPLTIGCAETETAGCRGTVYLDPAPASKGKSKGKGKAKKFNKGKGAKPRALAARRGRFGRSPFVIAAGKQSKLGIQLTALARKALGVTAVRKARAARRGRRISAVVTVVQHGKAPRRAKIHLRG